MTYSSILKIHFTTHHFLLISFLLLLTSTTQAQDYYFENIHIREGYGYYSDAHGEVIVPDGQGNYLSYHNGCALCGAVRLMKIDSNANELWAKTISAVDELTFSNLVVDGQGNINIFGYYNGSFDADPGPGVFNLPNSTFSNDYFMLKLDANGNFLFAKELRAGGNTTNCKGRMDNNNNSYVATSIKGTYDMDPGVPIYNLTSLQHSIALQKLDSQGNLVWAKQLSSTATVGSYSITAATQVDAQANFYITGFFSDSIDFDPDPAVDNYRYSPTAVNFILKLDKDGIFQWVKTFDYNPQSANYKDAVVDHTGNLYLAGSFRDTIDVDPGVGYVPLISQGNNDFYLLKYNPNGDLVWAKSAGGTQEDKAIDLFYHDGKIIYLGWHSGTADIALGAAVFNNTVINQGWHSEFFQTLDTSGNYLSSQVLFEGAYSRQIRVEPSGSVYITGGYSDADFDPSAGVAAFNDGPGGLDYFFLKLSKDSCKAFNLSLNRSTYLICQDTGIARVVPTYGLEPYQYSWNTGSTDSIIYYETVGLATVTVTDARGCTEISTVYLEGPKDTINNGFDLEPYLHGAYSRLRPGRSREFTLEGVNHYCGSADGYMYIVLDSLTTYSGSRMTPPDSILGDTLFWNFTNLTYDASLQVSFYVSADSTVIIGGPVSYVVGIYATGIDQDSSNNSKQYSGMIVNSYDPNRKSAYPSGVCAANFISKKEKISYTLQFQNTGTAYAIDIKIIDTLPLGLDINTLDIVSSSHTFELSPIDNNILIFNFNSISLPDSTTNEPASHGYVTFDIEADQSFVGDIVTENRVGIYFDLNPPIITNTVLRTFVDSIPVLNDGISFVNNALVANQANASYQWVDCNNNNIFLSGETGQSFLPNQDGSYAVLVQSGGCSSLSPCFDYIFLNLAETEQDNKIKVFPNPTNAVIQLIAPSHIVPFQLKIYDSWGRVVRTNKVSDSVSKLDLSDLPIGVYHLIYFSREGQEQVKIIKTN